MQNTDNRTDWPLVDWPLRKPTDEAIEKLLPGERRRAFEASQEMALLSIDPDASGSGVDSFHGYAVLGTLPLIPLKVREGLVGVLYDALGGSLDEPGEVIARCFHPHHGVRAVLNGITVEWLICFECFQAHIYCDGTKSLHGVAQGGRSYLNRLLHWAGIPMAPQRINGKWR